MGATSHVAVAGHVWPCLALSVLAWAWAVPVRAQASDRAVAVSSRIAFAPAIGAPVDRNAIATTGRLDLVTAINCAFAYNRTVLRARLDVSERRYAREEAEAAFSIRLTPEGGVGATDAGDEYHYGLRAARRHAWGGELEAAGGYTWVSDASTRESASLRVELTQPLFRNAGRLMTLEPVVQAATAEREARRAFYARHADLILQVVQAYESVITSSRRCEADRRALARLDGLLELTRSREQLGAAGRIDTLRVEQQHGEVASRLENSREQYRADVDDFADLIGLERATAWTWREPPILEIALPEMDEAVDIALSNRLDYAQVLEGYQTADRQVQIAYRRLLPDLNLVTRYGRTGSAESDPFSFDQEDWFAGLSIGSDLNMQASRSAYRGSQVARTDARVLIQDREYAIAREVRQQIRAYRRARVDFQITARNEELAGQRLELADSLFRLGKSDNFSVTDAENGLQSAQDAVLAARAESSLAAYRLLRAMDVLIECPSDLKPRPVPEEPEDDNGAPPALTRTAGESPGP